MKAATAESPLPASLEKPRIARRSVVIGAAAILALAAFITRRPDLWFAPQFWAEDGVEFFAEAEISGWHAWLKPYVGYFHFAPRSIAGLSMLVPWAFAPAVYVWGAGFVAAFVVARIAFSRLPLAPRIMGACAMVGAPHSGEVFLNVTNLNWILAGLLAVNLLEGAPVSRSESGRRGVEVLIAGWSGVTAVFLAPFAALWAWRYRRQPAARVIIAAWTLAIVGQVLALSFGSRAPTTGVESMLGALHWVIPRYAGSIFVGHWAPYTPFVGRILAVASLLAVGTLFLDRTNRHRSLAALMLSAGGGLILAGRMASEWWPNPLGDGARYAYIPLVLMLWAFAWLWAGTERRLSRAIALALYLCPLAASFSAWTAPRLPQFNWPQQVREVQAGTRSRFEIPPNHSFPVPQPGVPRVGPPFTPIR